MQIIAAALPVGVIAFLAIVLYMVHAQQGGRGMGQPGEVPLISLVAAGFLVVLVVVSFVMSASVTRQGVSRIAAAGPTATAADAGQLLGTFQTALIVSLAPLEGACFFGCIAYLLEGSPIALAAVAVGLALMLLRFPTEGRVRLRLGDLEDQLARARQEANLGGPGT